MGQTELDVRAAAKPMRIASTETGLLTLGVMLIAAYCGARAYAEVQRQQGIATFAEARSHTGASLHNTLGRVPDQTQWSEKRIRAYAGDFAIGPRMVPEAVLRIPRLRLAVPVYADTSERSLNRGAGLIAGTARPRWSVAWF